MLRPSMMDRGLHADTWQSLPAARLVLSGTFGHSFIQALRRQFPRLRCTTQTTDVCFLASGGQKTHLFMSDPWVLNMAPETVTVSLDLIIHASLNDPAVNSLICLSSIFQFLPQLSSLQL